MIDNQVIIGCINSILTPLLTALEKKWGNYYRP